MTENKRFRMETIGDVMLPFIVDNSTAKKKSDTITTYHTYETHRKEKCLELVDLLNDFSEENKQLKKENNELKLLVQNWEALDEEKDEQIDRQSQALKKLKKENEQLKSKNRGLQSELQIFKEDVTHSNLQISKLIDENEQLKQEIKDLRINVSDKVTEKDKSCGYCKNLQIDGMFGMWCDKGRNWQNIDANYCSDYER